MHEHDDYNIMLIMARYPAEHKRNTRERILEASERILKRDGIDGASVDAVMRAAGLTVGGFYAHFASKEDLAQQALLFAVEKTFARMTAGLDHVDDREFLRTLITRYLSSSTTPGWRGRVRSPCCCPKWRAAAPSSGRSSRRAPRRS